MTDTAPDPPGGLPPETAAEASNADAALADLVAARDGWARLPVPDRIAVLQALRDSVAAQAEAWVNAAATAKGLPPGDPARGEEWQTGPYAVLAALDGLIVTLRGLDGKRWLDALRVRDLATGQIAVRVLPRTAADRLILSGVTAEVWMPPGIDRAALRAQAGPPPLPARGSVALVLGAGNITAIAPLDALHRLLHHHQVVLIKANPVLAPLTPVLRAAFDPLADRGWLRIIDGGAATGDRLTRHPDIAAVHVTGAEATHDAIVWGTGPEAHARRAAGTPRLDKPITSELGGVGPTIVVPGPWSPADIAFQGENIASMKLHNGGANCIACQVLILPAAWDAADPLLDRARAIAGRVARRAWYPGADRRLDAFAAATGAAGAALLVAETPDGAAPPTDEVFAPALSVVRLPGGPDDPAAFLRAAITYANDRLPGTLGASILIHPATIRAIGRRRFERVLATLRYGTIGVNVWSGTGFAIAAAPWGAFPGHALDAVGSGIGTVHDTAMLGPAQRSVIEAPFAPFPRSLMQGQPSLLPRPPWFVTHRRAEAVGRALTAWQHRPAPRSLAALLGAALRG